MFHLGWTEFLSGDRNDRPKSILALHAAELAWLRQLPIERRCLRPQSSGVRKLRLGGSPLCGLSLCLHVCDYPYWILGECRAKGFGLKPSPFEEPAGCKVVQRGVCHRVSSIRSVHYGGAWYGGGDARTCVSPFMTVICVTICLRWVTMTFVEFPPRLQKEGWHLVNMPNLLLHV